MTGAEPEVPAADRTADRAALNRLLGVPEMAWLVARVRGRILAAQGEPLVGVVQLNEPTGEQRAAAVRLVGRPKRAGSALRVDLAAVEQILRRGPWPAGLADAVQTLSGPVVDRRAERHREAAAWEAAREGLAATIARFPHVAPWWVAWCQAGGLKRMARAEAARTSTAASPAVAADLVQRLDDLVEALPASGEPLAVLARRIEGDAHSLDASRPLGRLAVAVIAVAFMPGTAGSDREPGAATSAAELSARDAWAAAGVVMSNVASTVLCLGVPGQSRAGGTASGHTARVATGISLEAMRAARMPVLLTLDQVRSGGVRALPGNSVIHICENPTVVEVVAARWAQSVAPAGRPTTNAIGCGSDPVAPVLVCTSGQPSTAVLDLVRRLAGNGAQCRYHGDFDWAGLRIAQSLAAHVDWVPWRYTADDYSAAIRQGKPARQLVGSPAHSPWDPQLAIAMAEGGLAVEEEAVADRLAADVLAPPS